jgi:hypothetical protein
VLDFSVLSSLLQSGTTPQSFLNIHHLVLFAGVFRLSLSMGLSEESL